METENPWHTAPRKTAVVFLAGVFFIFASFGFVNDVIDMGVQSTSRFAFGVALSGLFAVAYAGTGIALRGRFWKAFIPLFALHFLCMAWLGNAFPEAAHPAQLSAAATAHLEKRLLFDGLAIIASVSLGYAGLIYVSIAEGRRHIRARVEKAALESEMSAAREVQRVMVPEELPQVVGYSIESVYRPAAEVGGDFFQVIPLRSGRTLVVLGDVSGKGLRAAMIVSMIVGTLRAVSGYTEEPAEILGELNRRLCGSMHEGFVTCLAVRVETGGRLTLANAGHLPPYVNGTEIGLAGSLPLGVTETAAYEQTSLELSLRDVLMLVTDGIAEAQSGQHVLLGFAKVEQMLRAGSTAKSVADTAQQYGQNDDITALSVTRLA